MRRSGKYLNAREYAQRLAMDQNPDIADFGRDFLEALDFFDEGTGDEPIRVMVDRHTRDAGLETFREKIDWLCSGSDMLGRVEELIEKGFPEYADEDADDAVAKIVERFQPVKFLGGQKMEYDL